MISMEQRVINAHEVRETVAAGYSDWRELVRAAVAAYERLAHASEASYSPEEEKRILTTPGVLEGIEEADRILDEMEAAIPSDTSKSLIGTTKPPCEFPLPDGRRCLECAGCHPTPEEQAAWVIASGQEESRA